MHQYNVPRPYASEHEIDDFRFRAASVVCGVETPQSELQVLAAHSVEDFRIPAPSWRTQEACLSYAEFFEDIVAPLGLKHYVFNGRVLIESRVSERVIGDFVPCFMEQECNLAETLCEFPHDKERSLNVIGS